MNWPEGVSADRESRLFLGAAPEEAYARCAIAIVGAPLDVTVSYRPGTRFGPGRVRDVSVVLETYSPELDADLETVSFCDLGDLSLPYGDVRTGLQRLEEAAARIAGDGKRIIVLGGEHALTPAVVRGVLRSYPDLAVLQFDAHADLRDDYLGVRESHATAMRRVADAVGFERLAQVGLRSGTREEFALGRETGSLQEGPFLEGVEAALRRLAGRPLYVTVDIDVCDPGFAPGVGTPEPGGITPSELLAAIRRTCAGGTVVAADVVEVLPAADHSDVTAVLAAKVVRELLLGMGREQQ